MRTAAPAALVNSTQKPVDQAATIDAAWSDFDYDLLERAYCLRSAGSYRAEPLHVLNPATW